MTVSGTFNLFIITIVDVSSSAVNSRGLMKMEQTVQYNNKLILTDFFISGLSCVGIIFTYIDANYNCYIKMMYMSLNSKTTGVTSGATTDFTSRAHGFTPVF